MLENEGVVGESPKSDFEAFRGTYHGASVVITVKGEIHTTESKLLTELIDRIYKLLNQENDTETRYVVLAKHSFPDHSYPVNHLNLWLNKDQYRTAVDLIIDAGGVLINTHESFEDYHLELDGYQISFHDNGKVIAEDGYGTFAPLLTQAIEQHQHYREYDLIIGQDEVGTGERIGPVVIGSVAATPAQLTDLQLSGIKDSKMVPRALSTIMSHWVRDLSTMVSTYQMNPSQFNKKVLGDRMSVNEIVTYCHDQAVNQMIDLLQVYTQFPPKVLYLVDQYDRNYTIPSLESTNLDFDVKYLPTAELESPAVAAASVVAKSERFRWIQLHEKVYNIALNRKRIRQIRQHGKSHELLKVMG
jgi:ribonuclease HIII